MSPLPGRAALLCLAISLLACHPEIHHSPPDSRSFYYWKSGFSLNTKERDYLSALQVTQLYMRFFDVTWDEQQGRPTPTAPVRFKDSANRDYTFVPVVFITNETLVRLDSTGIAPLAANIGGLVQQIGSGNKLRTAPELQLDCDWTAGTRDRYFGLITAIRHWLDDHGQPSTQLSATIRLYQCKYRDKTGVPPVARGLLMCYNMGNRKDVHANNSIIGTGELENYVGKLGAYPLPLDIALPIFDWKVLFHGEKYEGLVESLPTTMLGEPAAVPNSAVMRSGNRYIFRQDTLIGDYSFAAGDWLRDEQSDYATVLAVAGIVARKLKRPPGSVILFHLDSANLSNYTPNELQTLYNRFY